VSAGKELLRRGEFAYEFMVIEDGQAEVTRAGERSPMCLIVMTAQDLRQLASSRFRSSGRRSAPPRTSGTR
jgi:hypothetical protein